MDGVIILDKTTAMIVPDWGEIIAGAGMGIFLIFAWVGIICLIEGVNKKSTIIIFGICVLGFLMGISYFFLPKVPDITYKVIVEDNVNMNDFFNKYELIKQEGLIYTVKLKGD